MKCPLVWLVDLSTTRKKERREIERERNKERTNSNQGRKKQKRQEELCDLTALLGKDGGELQQEEGKGDW